jgi:hypothetical protein
MGSEFRQFERLEEQQKRLKEQFGPTVTQIKNYQLLPYM